MKIIMKPDKRTAGEWEVWAKAKIANEPRLLSNAEIAELETLDCIEFEIDNPKKQQIVKGK